MAVLEDLRRFSGLLRRMAGCLKCYKGKDVKATLGETILLR
jgi:hypothetical protein